MTSQTAYDRYSNRYNNDVYLAATRGMTNDEAVALQDTALMLCEHPTSRLANWVRDNASGDDITAFLALFVV